LIILIILGEEYKRARTHTHTHTQTDKCEN
jgi:hypothetical protein